MPGKQRKDPFHNHDDKSGSNPALPTYAPKLDGPGYKLKDPIGAHRDDKGKILPGYKSGYVTVADEVYRVKLALLKMTDEKDIAHIKDRLMSLIDHEHAPTALYAISIAFQYMIGKPPTQATVDKTVNTVETSVHLHANVEELQQAKERLAQLGIIDSPTCSENLNTPKLPYNHDEQQQ